MSTQLTTPTFAYDELPEHARLRALAVLTSVARTCGWWSSIYDDAEMIGLEITEHDLGGRVPIRGALTRPMDEVIAAIFSDHAPSCSTYQLAQKYAQEPTSSDLEGEFTRALLDCYLGMIMTRYTYLQSRCGVEDFILANEYQFDGEGTIITR